jgi:hypothetical protein
MKNNNKRSIAIAIAMTTLCLLGCTVVAVNTLPDDIRLWDPVLCQGWDEDDNPILLSDIVPSDNTEICICGHLEADFAPYLQVFWNREKNRLEGHKGQFKGPFLDCIQSEEGFEPGSYSASVIAGKTTLVHIEFTVRE